MGNGRLRPWLASFAAVFSIALGAALLATPAAANMSPRIKPPAPAPQYVTRNDLERLGVVRRAIGRRDFAAARAAAATLDDPIAASLAQWFYFDAEDPAVSPVVVDAFLDAHPDWPSTTKIQMHGERRMSQATTTSDVLAFFDTRDPITGEGHLHLARALYAAGERDAAEAQIRSAWINNNFEVGDEQKLLATYGGVLTPEDHAARVDRLLFERQVTTARRIFSRLTTSERRKAEARAALLLRAANAPTLFNGIPNEERLDSGPLLAAVRYYRRSGEEARAVELARRAPTDPEDMRNPSRWWDEMQLLMRWALTERRYEDAYAMAALHGHPTDTSDFAEAEFNAGWIAMRFLGEPDRAATHFAALTRAVATPISVSRGLYWQGRAAEAAGETDTARAFYSEAAQHIYSFYGQLAAERVGGDVAATLFAPEITPSPADKARFSSRPVVAALRILSEMDDERALLIFAYHADDELETPGEYVELARLVERKGATHLAVRAGKAGVRRNAFAAEVVYPLVFVPDEATRFAPPEVILGLSRQESEFNPRAFSRAGARGLMQLIPSTAQITARKEGLPYSRNALLDDPVYNMMIGSAHLSHLFQRFNGSLVMTFAAYNAGAGRVDQWVERYGDPRAPEVDPVDWVEQIPFEETRNYVQRVLENTQVYRARLNETPIAGRLSSDLEIGGTRGRAGALPGLDIAGDLPPIPERIVAFASVAPHAAPEGVRVKPPTEEAGSVAPAAAPAAAPSIVPAVKETNRTAPDRSRTATAIQPASAPAPTPGEDAARERDAAQPAAKIVSPTQAPSADAAAPAPKTPDGDDAADVSAAALNAASKVTAIAGPSEDAASRADCRSYADYLAAADPDNVSADDLNAGMRAELSSGGPDCFEDDGLARDEEF